MATNAPDNFEIRNIEVETAINEIGAALRRAMPVGWGFGLLIVKEGEGPGIFYTSNMNRQDMVRTMQDFVDMARKEGCDHAFPHVKRASGTYYCTNCGEPINEPKR